MEQVSLAERYFKEGADEISFLNITGFRDFPLSDLPMLEVGPFPTSVSPHACTHSIASRWLSLGAPLLQILGTTAPV